MNKYPDYDVNIQTQLQKAKLTREHRQSSDKTPQLPRNSAKVSQELREPNFFKGASKKISGVKGEGEERC